jgi:SAM-dependent methyltransferase
MQRLMNAVEWLDGPLDDTVVLTDNLRDLRRINRWSGGAHLSAKAIDVLLGDRKAVHLLDVGTGGADIPLGLIRRADGRGVQMTAVGIDSRPEVLAAAARANPASTTDRRLELRLGDGRNLPYPDRSFDIVHASLVHHHLEPAGAETLLHEMARVSRWGVVVNDLDRTLLGWMGAWLVGHLLTGNRYTRHDAPLSVRRAYRADEMADLLRISGLIPMRLFRGVAHHRYAIAAGFPSEAGG